MMLEKRIAIYIRLSNADEETGKTKDESNSVRNQRNLIHQFLDGHLELSKYPRAEFIDDGFTGTNMNRPAFQRMITAIKDGEYFCCITKDFSRFARDYIEMGDYLECLFPFLGVRYISINDNYDSRDYQGTTGGLDVVMRAIIYDAYSKDLSIKSKTGRSQARKKGRRVCGLPGYGYKKDPNQKAMDIIDPEAAVVVRRIFDAAIKGMTLSEIATMLNSEGVPTPSEYFRQNNPQNRKFLNTSKKQRWSYGIIYPILKRFAYTGAAVGGIRENIAPCSKSLRIKNKSEWVIVPNMHEAIITPEEYELAQKAIGDKLIIGKDYSPFPLKSLVFCGNCLRRMVKSKQYNSFRCQYGGVNGDEGCCKIRVIKESKIEEIVFHEIQKYLQTVYQKKIKQQAKFKKSRKDNSRSYANIEKLNRRIEFLKRSKFREYEQYASGTISKDKYVQAKQHIDAEISRLQADIEEAQKQSDLSIAESRTVYSEFADMCEVFRNEKSLTYEMAHTFVKRILVYPNEDIKIEWRLRDDFT